MIGWVDELQQAIADRIRDGIPDKLALLVDAYHDGIELPNPAEIWPCDKAQINATPAVEVWCPDSAAGDPTSSSIEYNHRLTVIWTIGGSDEVVMDKQIKRYLLATALLLDGISLGPFSPLVVGTMTFLVVDNSIEAPWARTAAIEIASKSEIAQFAL